MTMLAFDLADMYRTPVMILGDVMLGQMMEAVDLEAVAAHEQAIRRQALAGADDDEVAGHEVRGGAHLLGAVAEHARLLRELAAPLNAKRLNRKTPCVSTLRCMDCSSPDRICRKKSIIDRPEPGRIHVLIVAGDWGL